MGLEPRLVVVKDPNNRGVEDLGSGLEAFGLGLAQLNKALSVVQEGLTRIVHVAHDDLRSDRGPSDRGPSNRGRSDGGASSSGFLLLLGSFLAQDGVAEYALSFAQVSDSLGRGGGVGVEAGIFIVSPAVQESISRKLEGLQHSDKRRRDLLDC